jgi:DNA mismatch repair protein MutS2
METLLTEIDQEKSRAQKERRDAEEDRRQMEALREEYDRKILEIETQRDEILQSATRDADGAIQEVLQDLRDARQEWRKSMKDHKEGKKDRLEVKENEKMVRTLLNDTISRLKKIQEDTHAPGAESPAFPFQPGQLVNVTTTGRRGRVDRILDNFSALVDVGSVRMEIPMAHLEPVDVDFSDLPQPVQDLRLKKVLSISDQLDLRGHRVDEGLSALEKYVDDACLANLDSFRIIHGKGTGALRDAVQQYLRSCPVVKGFREGELHEGGWGVTVVNL